MLRSNNLKKHDQHHVSLILALLVLIGVAILVSGPARFTASASATIWSAPVNLGAVINSTASDQGPAISPDGLSLYVTSNRPGGLGGFDMYVSHRTSVFDSWGPLINLGPALNTAFDEGNQAFSRDGRLLFFQSKRPGGFGGIDIWVARRNDPHDDFAWQPAVNLGPGVNSAADDNGPSYFEDDVRGTRQLYFGSARPGLGGADIYVSEQMADDSFGPATRVTELSTVSNENRPAIRQDGLEIFFQSNRTGSIAGSGDLWVATRGSTADAWSTPVNLGSGINTASVEQNAYLSSDGMTLFFSSDRSGGSGGLDLYMSTRTLPTVTSKNISVAADDSCSASISPSDVDDGSFDSVNGSPLTLSLDPAAGGPFGLGEHTVRLIATDDRGQTNSAIAIVTVVDQTPPTITAPPAVAVAAEPSACGAFISDAVLGAVTANDNCSVTITTTRSGVPAGNFFPIGTTIITYTAADAAGNTAFGKQSVTVIDDTLPKITAPPAVTISTGPGANSCGASVSDAVLGTATASDNCSVTTTRSGVPAGNFFPVGTTIITYTAIDGAGNTSSATQSVTVIDDTPPVITGASVDKPTLWPPNHQMVDVTVSYTATDNCGAVDTALSISSNEPVNGPGDGNTAPDGEVVDAHHVRLRAERSGQGSGRVYTITITAADSFGNLSSQLVTVRVPHN